MANKYHDELGRFCSAGEMRAGVDRLVEKGDNVGAFALLSEYKSIQEVKKKGSFFNRLIGERSLEGYGSRSEWSALTAKKHGYRGLLAHYLSGQYPESKAVGHLTSMFVVHAEAFKELAQLREEQGVNVAQDKAVYRTMLKETLNFFETFSEFGKSSKAPSDSRVESYLISRADSARRAGTDQGRIDAIAFGKMLDVFEHSSEDEDWESYPARARAMLVRLDS